ncbi:MAG: carbamoyltransferase [Bacteroidetes bacterium]|nr:carbamoyltransferase [Bacteroidota bacterium]
MNVIGISAYYHDSACCIIRDGELIAAAQEERFTRIKHDPALPVNAFKFCLKQADLSIDKIDAIAYYEDPVKKLSRQLWCGADYFNEAFTHKMDPSKPEREIREILGFGGKIEFVDHHLSHAASSYYFSGFKSAALLTMDGVGEWATTTYGIAKDRSIDLFEEVHFPDSVGLLYSTITSYLGFGVNSGEYKVMGLAPYGEPLYIDKLYELIQLKEKGQYKLNLEYFDFIRGNTMFSGKLAELMGQPVRKKESELLKFHLDVAKSLQVVLEQILLEKAKYLHSVTGEDNLCMAGGVALNCVANGKLLREGPFKKMFVQPASNDAGGALGAAAHAYAKHSGNNIKSAPLRSVFLGPEYTNADIRNLLDATSLNSVSYETTEEMQKATAQRLAKGKVIGWFQGRMEFGPRALGGRSILADPRNPEMRDRINAMVKKREAFRPFAPAILEDKTKKYFDLSHSSPFMLETCQVVSEESLPAITHVDKSARVQTVNEKDNPCFAGLLAEFEKLTGCPILLNTSFNVRGEPIVCTPADAFLCFVNTDIDCLVLGNTIIDRENNNMEDLVNMVKSIIKRKKRTLNHDVYTFI